MPVTVAEGAPISIEDAVSQETPLAQVTIADTVQVTIANIVPAGVSLRKSQGVIVPMIKEDNPNVYKKG